MILTTEGLATPQLGLSSCCISVCSCLEVSYSWIDWLQVFPMQGGGTSAHVRRRPAHATGPGTQAPPPPARLPTTGVHTVPTPVSVCVHGTVAHISHAILYCQSVSRTFRAVVGGFSKVLAVCEDAALGGAQPRCASARWELAVAVRFTTRNLGVPAWHT